MKISDPLEVPLAEAWPEESSPDKEPNLHRYEQWASTAIGAALMLFGLKHRGVRGIISIVAGLGCLQRGTTGHCALYEKFGINTAERDFSESRENSEAKIEATLTVNRSREELYRFWRDFSNLPQLMSYLERVENLSETRSRWIAKPIGEKAVEWEAEIINERPNELIAWETLPGADVSSAGSVRFEDAPGDRGTEISIKMQYHPPGGRLTSTLLTLLGQSPETQIREDLHRFKQFMEAKELTHGGSHPSNPSKS